jgi:hypothetical protein
MVAADNGWPNVIHACKENEKKKRLDQIRYEILRRKKAYCLVERSVIFGC